MVGLCLFEVVEWRCRSMRGGTAKQITAVIPMASKEIIKYKIKTQRF